MSEIDPAEAVADAVMASAKSAAESRFRRELRSRIPRILWPLIPGERGSVTENVQREAGRRFRRWVSGVIFSIVFFVVFFSLVCGVFAFAAGSVGWALYAG